MRTSDAQRCLGLEHLLWYDLNTSSCCISPRNASRFAPRHNQIVGMSKNEPPTSNRLLIARLTARSKKVDTLASEDRLTECPSSIRSLHCSPVLQDCLWSTRSSPSGVAWSLKFLFQVAAQQVLIRTKATRKNWWHIACLQACPRRVLAGVSADSCRDVPDFQCRSS